MPMNTLARPPLTRYVVGVLIAWAIVLCLARFIGGEERFTTVALLCTGFFLGMLAMYIAVHLYKWQ